MFIRDGKIVLAASMDEVGERYTEVMVPHDKVNAANALQPIDQRTVFGKSVMLFDSAAPGAVSRSQLAALGETRIPSVADLFVATMKGTYA
jgi:ABC-2 type transport system ATP-binding protein